MPCHSPEVQKNTVDAYHLCKHIKFIHKELNMYLGDSHKHIINKFIKEYESSLYVCSLELPKYIEKNIDNLTALLCSVFSSVHEETWRNLMKFNSDWIHLLGWWIDHKDWDEKRENRKN